jgi:hypothetical protein
VGSLQAFDAGVLLAFALCARFCATLRSGSFDWRWGTISVHSGHVLSTDHCATQVHRRAVGNLRREHCLAVLHRKPVACFPVICFGLDARLHVANVSTRLRCAAAVGNRASCLVKGCARRQGDLLLPSESVNVRVQLLFLD